MMMMDGEICWKKKDRHHAKKKNTLRHEQKKMDKGVKFYRRRMRNRHHPGITESLLDVEPEDIQDLTDKVTAYCISDQRFGYRTCKRMYRKKRETYHRNLGKLLHKNPTYIEDYKKHVTAYSVASCEDWYVIVDPASNDECFIWSCVSHQKIQLPTLRITMKRYYKCILTAPPTEKHSEVLFFHRECPLIVCCRVGYKRWTLLDYDVDEFFNQSICCKSKIYVTRCDIRRLYEIETRRWPAIKLRAHPKIDERVEMKSGLGNQHLVESCGEVFLVERPSVSRLEVYRMDFVHDEWAKVHSLGNRVFFLSCFHSVSFDAEEFGLEGNCIYFTDEEDVRSLYVYNLEDQSLFVYQNRPNCGALWLLWEGKLPVLRLADNSSNEQPRVEDEAVVDVNAEHKHVTLFDLLPLDVMGKIGQCLGVGRHYMNFRLVCRQWRLAAPPCRWHHDSTSSVMRCPWLLFFSSQQKDTCNFYDPGQCLIYHKKTTGLSTECVIRFSQEGWLLCSQGEDSLFLFEQFTQKRIQLPVLPCEDPCGLCFSGTPGSSDFALVGIGHVDSDISLIFLLSPTFDGWLRNEKLFIPTQNNPVFLNGNFYFLGQDGSLGQLTHFPEGQQYRWKVLNRRHKLQLPTTVYQSFLVSAREAPLLSVFVGSLGEWVCVYRFDTRTRKWLISNSLEDCTLFLSGTKSILLAAEENEARMKNKIYFPRFSRTNGYKILSYSMEACRFQTDDNNNIQENFYGTKEVLNCTWFQDRLIPPPF